MDKLTVYARAKINLSLDVLSKIDDGYHEIISIMQSVDLHDDIQISTKSGNGQIRVRTSRAYLPKDGKNIAGKAVKLFFDKQNIKGQDVTVYIHKRNPVCAGLGGGSADGAAVLRGMNTLFETGLDSNALKTMGEKLGADVPFCIEGGTALAKGKGEKLTNVPPLPECHVVICKPEFSVSTPELFSRIDNRRIKLRPDTDGMITALCAGDLNGVSKRLYNVFEELIAEEHGEIKSIKDTLYDSGALGASMSGTGSAVFGLFDNKAKATNAWEQLKIVYKECFLTKTV